MQSPGDPQTFNRYAYARNNPLKYTDPIGNFAFLIPFLAAVIKGAIIGAVIGATLGAIDAAINANRTPLGDVG